jgi:subtilisin family serine protease
MTHSAGPSPTGLTTFAIVAFTVGLSVLSASSACAQSDRSNSTTVIVSAVGSNCDSNQCSKDGSGCASCAVLEVQLPATAWVLKSHCYTSAGYPEDYGLSDLREVECGVDQSWSIFDTPSVTANQTRVSVTTIYRNRSGDRSRAVKLVVDWAQSEPDNLLNAATSEASTDAAESQPTIPEEIVNEAISAIALKGCDAYVGNSLKSSASLRSCFETNAKSPDDAARLKSLSSSAITEAAGLAVRRIWDQYQVRANFNWVMDHEGQRGNFESLAHKNDVTRIREIYRSKQAHNPDAENILSALSDHEVSLLVLNPDSLQSEAAPAVEFVNQLEQTLLGSNCSAFIGESLQNTGYLRGCFSEWGLANHNAEAVELLRAAPPQVLSSATRAAVVQIKRDYKVRQVVGSYLVNAQKLDSFRQLVSKGGMATVRQQLALTDVAKTNIPHLWNSLADSELSAIIMQPRLNVILSPGPSDPQLANFASLLDTAPVQIQPSTTVKSLSDSVCGPASPFSITGSCERVVRGLIMGQGARVDPSGHIQGATAVALPKIPQPGQMALVSFRPDLTGPEVGSALASQNVSYEQPAAAALVQSLLNTDLAPATIAKFAPDGLKWFAYAVSADKISATDLNLAGDPIKVGIIDSGVDIDQPVLQPFFWKVPTGTKWPVNSIGWDYIRITPSPMEDDLSQIDCHGTRVSGIVTMRAFETWFPEFKKLSLNKHIQIYELKVAGLFTLFGQSGVGIPDYSYPSDALQDGLKSGVHLFNLSLRGPNHNMLRQLMDEYVSNGLIINAAGNEQLNLDQQPYFEYDGGLRKPTTHDPLDNVLFVAALSDSNDLLTDSNLGPNTVQIAAPGSNILSTIRTSTSAGDSCEAFAGDSRFGVSSGTSEAAPIVTATAALLLAEHNGATPRRLKERILNTCDLNQKLDQKIANGCNLNMAAAVVENYDVVELTTGEWKRGTVSKANFPTTDNDGTSLNPDNVDRLWIQDGSGLARASIKDLGFKALRLTSPSIRIELKPGESCPTSGATPCEIAVKDVKDVILRWND